MPSAPGEEVPSPSSTQGLCSPGSLCEQLGTFGACVGARSQALVPVGVRLSTQANGSPA